MMNLRNLMFGHLLSTNHSIIVDIRFWLTMYKCKAEFAYQNVQCLSQFVACLFKPISMSAEQIAMFTEITEIEEGLIKNIEEQNSMMLVWFIIISCSLKFYIHRSD